MDLLRALISCAHWIVRFKKESVSLKPSPELPASIPPLMFFFDSIANTSGTEDPFLRRFGTNSEAQLPRMVSALPPPLALLESMSPISASP
ncbi:unannotated protein [freshwater metagenome]|uniref:Unannotated protein n=1 Tax=freshwater metagenome TaxID=449393 RepID=A0A6J6L201_9ZZZZ